MTKFRKKLRKLSFMLFNKMRLMKDVEKNFKF